jgi:predicted DNA-binding transcriptional regulator AlpA
MSASGSSTHQLPRAVGWPSPLIESWLRERIAATGGDPTIVPQEEFRFLRMEECERRTGLARSSIYRRIQQGTFPAPVPLGVTQPQNAA